MAKITSKDYHDYVIKNGKFIGEFEQMYQNVKDPWNHGAADISSYDMALYLMDKYNICKKGGAIFDIGCGKGAFTHRIKKACPKAKILAVDISETAVKKAKSQHGNSSIDFRVMDIQKEYKSIAGKFDLIVVSNVMWYILPDFSKIMNYLKGSLKNNGYVLIRQTFYKKGEQKYGNNIISSPEDMVSLLSYNLVELIELNRTTVYEAVVLLQKN